MFKDIYKNKKVLITGHTGFKGSWLALWLSKLGANVIGYSLIPPTEPNHFQLLNLDIFSITGDIRNYQKLKQIVKEHQPEIIFHLAAQAIVRKSYLDPIETFSTNVMGTVNIFEAARCSESVRAIINITSDKCYENNEWPWGYRENDRLGGFDPYSASKGCAEILTSCWQKSFFSIENHGKTHQTLLASARAGNVIGGGDWAPDRLIPDIMRAIHNQETVKIRNPYSTRPWQHVLEPLSGYLLLGQKLLEGEKDFAEAWNFGPSDDGNKSVEEIVRNVKKDWPILDYEIAQSIDEPHEARLLRLDCSKAKSKLKWQPVWNSDRAIEKTTHWYKNYYESNNILSLEHINDYSLDAKSKHVSWTE